MIQNGLYFIFIFSNVIFADPPPNPLLEICKPENDPKGYCQRLTKANGTPVSPKETVVTLISQTSDILKSKAQTAGIDPRALAGSLIAENTMNVQVDETAIDALVALKIAPTANVFGHQFTMGFGQINPDTAMSVEAEAAKLFGRKERSMEEIAAALNTIEGSYEYAAVIIKNVQDEYKKQGYDISNNPGLLATVYNLGQPAERAASAKAEGRNPKLNYFGYFVNKNIFAIEKAISGAGTSQDYQPVEDQEDLQYLKSPLKVFRSVPVCNRSGRGDDEEYYKAISYRPGVEAGSVQGYFTIVSRSVDCDLQPWLLIKDQNGKIGWVSNDDLSKAVSIRKPWPFQSAYTACPVSRACQDEVQKLTGRVLSFLPNDSSIALVKYQVRDPKLPVDVATYSSGCERFWREKTSTTQSAPSQNQNDNWNNMSDLKKRQTLKKINELEKKIQERFKGIKISQTTIGQKLQNLRDDIESCDGTRIKCRVDDGILNSILNIPATDGTISGYTTVLKHFSKSDFHRIVDRERVRDQNENNRPSPNDQTIKLLVASVGPVCLSATQGVPEVNNEIKNFLNELKNIGEDKNVREAKRITTSLLWLCRKAHSIFERNPAPYSTGNETPNKCQFCGFRIDGQTQFNAEEVDAFAMQIDKKMYASMIKNSFTDMSYSIASSLNLNRNPFSISNSTMYRGKSDEEICNYDPLKTKELVSKLLGSNCVQSVMAKDPYIQNSFRNGSKPVLDFESMDASKFGVQLKTDCNLEEPQETAPIDTRR